MVYTLLLPSESSSRTARFPTSEPIDDIYNKDPLRSAFANKIETSGMIKGRVASVWENKNEKYTFVE